MLLAVLWRLRYKLSFRDMAELLLERGYAVTYETIREWEFRFAPLLADQLRAKRSGSAGVSWYIDETYVKVAGRFLRGLIQVAERRPFRITTDAHPAYRKAIRWIVGRKVQHLCNQYLNNWIEQDHRGIKQRYYPMRGFGRFASAARFCSAFDELRQYFRVLPRPSRPIPLATQRRLFVARWQSLSVEMQAA